MASSDHKAGARPATAPSKPTNALGRPYWLLGLSAETTGDALSPRTTHDIATCATLTKGAHSLARILCNSEAFRALQDACDGTDPSQAPFDASLTEGLFAALYVLSQQAEDACTALLDEALGESDG